MENPTRNPEMSYMQQKYLGKYLCSQFYKSDCDLLRYLLNCVPG
jgi:hypothetical protein